MTTEKNMSDSISVPVINWFEEPIKESVMSVFRGTNAFVESLDLFKTYRTAHFEMLMPQVSGVKILGMQQSMDLRKLYYPASISTNIRRRIYAADWTLFESNRTKRVDKAKTVEAADGYISKNQRVVVLGGPGAGKTTFLRFLALAYSDSDIFKKSKLGKSQLPVYLHLPQLARDESAVIDHICRPLIEKTGEHAFDFYSRLLDKGQCTVLLDSLDEVPIASRQSVIDRVIEFSNLYPASRIVLSCRTADYDRILDGFSEVELSRLSKVAVASIIRAWFDKDRERGEKLIALLESDGAVSSLTETPLLLSLLCIQFRNDLALPKKRTELYRRCVDALLRDWDTTRGFRRDTAYSQLSDDRKERIFESIAGSACKNTIDYEMTEPHLLNVISETISRFSLDPEDAKGILSEIENHHGILEKCSMETYEFSHGTMHEYFAARYFVAKRMEMEVLKKHYDDEQWHNVIMFMVSILDDPSDLLGFLVVKSTMNSVVNYPALAKRLVHLLLLYRCIAIGVSIPTQLRAQICRHLVDSQIQMLSHLNKDGIYPFAARIPNGVRQPLFSTKKYRESLIKILLPYRRLMNEIVLSPIREYGDAAAEVAKGMALTSDLYGTLGQIVCIICPISDLKPEFFLQQMLKYSEAMLGLNLSNSVRAVLVESITYHQSAHYGQMESAGL